MYDETWQPTCEQQDGASVGAMRSGASLRDGYSMRLRTRRAEEVACGGSPGRLVPCEAACDTGCVGSSRLRSVRGVRTPTPLKRGDAGECPLSLVSPCIGSAEPGTSRPTELCKGREAATTGLAVLRNEPQWVSSTEGYSRGTVGLPSLARLLRWATTRPGSGGCCRMASAFPNPADTWATTWASILDLCADMNGAPLVRTPPRRSWGRGPSPPGWRRIQAVG